MIRSSVFSQESSITIPSCLGGLEALIGAGAPGTCAVLCAPHPHFDGTMYNKVVATATKTCIDFGLSTVRFNYRGVGASKGSLPTYAGATQDIVFVLDFITKKGFKKILWLGFSYGSYVAAYGSGLTNSLALITIAPSVANMPYQDLPDITCPWHMLQGMQDEVIDIKANIDLAKQVGCSVHEFQDTGHFFHGKLSVLRETLAAIIAETTR